MLPIGLDFETVDAVSLDLNKTKNLLLFSDHEEGLSLLKESMIKTINESTTVKILIIDSEELLNQFQDKCATYISG